MGILIRFPHPSPLPEGEGIPVPNGEIYTEQYCLPPWRGEEKHIVTPYLSAFRI